MPPPKDAKATKAKHNTIRPITEAKPKFKADPKHLEFVVMDKAKRNDFLLRNEKSGDPNVIKRVPQIAAHIRMAELGFDPLAMSVAIAKGEALTQDHPFLVDLTIKIFSLLNDLEKGTKIDWEGELKRILDDARASLTDSHVPLHLRSDHVKELMGYLYPKLKATEHSGTIQHALRVKPLAVDEVETFKLAFNEGY